MNKAGSVIMLLFCGALGWAIYTAITGDNSFMSVIFGTLIGVPLGFGALKLMQLQDELSSLQLNSKQNDLVEMRGLLLSLVYSLYSPKIWAGEE